MKTFSLDWESSDHHGRFQRVPLIFDAADIPKLKAALAATPKLRKPLGKLR